MTDGPAIVEVENLTKVFAGPPSVHALNACSFTIHRGESVSIVGPSGSGKSTLLSLLGLLDVPTSGRYRLDQRDVAALSDRQRAGVRATKIGFVFQAFHLVGYRSVIDNVDLGLLYQGVDHRERRLRSAEVIDQVGLAHRTWALCSTLSGGERQRVAIARTLVRRPSLVLCDEPTGNLDSATAGQILGLLQTLSVYGITVLTITHDPTTASLAGRTFRMADGTLSEDYVSC